MSTIRDTVRDRIIEINNTCADNMHDGNYSRCTICPDSIVCEFLLAFDEWIHMHTYREAGDEDLERLVDSVMTIEGYEDLLMQDEEV